MNEPSTPLCAECGSKLCNGETDLCWDCGWHLGEPRAVVAPHSARLNPAEADTVSMREEK